MRSRVLLAKAERPQRLAFVPVEEEPPVAAHAATRQPGARDPSRLPPATASPRPHSSREPRFFSLSFRLGALIAFVSSFGVAAGIVGLGLGTSNDLLGLLVVAAIVGGGQALALEVDEGAISFSAVGALAGAALFGPRAALVLALTTVVVDWSARRTALKSVLFNLGALTLASLGARQACSPRPAATGRSSSPVPASSRERCTSP